MLNNLHAFHIPVMGLGHSVDSPIRVAHLGINSVISIVDDLLLEKIRKHYCGKYQLPYQNIPRSADDGRAKRIKAYLNTVQQIVQHKFEELKELPLFQDTEKDRYFGLLPDSSTLKLKYLEYANIGDKVNLSQQIQCLTDLMQPGSIDVNIMAKVDAQNYDQNGEALSGEFTDASAALRGFAESSLNSSLVLSAGFNPRLYSYLAEFKDFYRDATGTIKKNIILKVSDFRSALIQGKFLAKKGLEVAEFRIESGLNCGGHAFPSDGELLPVLLKEFKEKRDQFSSIFQPLVTKYYDKMGWTYPKIDEIETTPALTVQGGIGINGEMQRLLNEYNVDATGWGSPFLLVPEATCVDEETTQLLRKTDDTDLYLSNVSPFGIPFNNVKGTGSEVHTKALIDKGKPGSKCPKGFLASNTEFTDKPICTASNEYQTLKLNEIEQSELTESEKERSKSKILDKTCLCTNLGTGALIRLGIQKPSYGRQAICPGPNISWFDDEYTLDEMIDHIYGRGDSLVPEKRPHMFAKELIMYVDYLETLMLEDEEDQNSRKIKKTRKNLEKGMDYLMEIAHSDPYGAENLRSISQAISDQRQRMEAMFGQLEVA